MSTENGRAQRTGKGEFSRDVKPSPMEELTQKQMTSVAGGIVRTAGSDISGFNSTSPNTVNLADFEDWFWTD